MDSHQLTTILKLMAWERAKGELRAMMRTFYSLSEDEYEENAKVIDEINELIKRTDARIAE